PVTLLSLLLPAADAITFIAAMTYFLAALSAFLFLRTVCKSETAALFGAIAWCFSNHIVSFILTAHGAAIAVFPLVLFGVHEVARSRSPRNIALLTAAMILTTLCGHPETLLHIALIVLAYTLFVTRENLAAVLGRVAGAGALTLLLTAVFLAPLFAAILETREFQDRALHDGARQHNSWQVVLHLLRADIAPFADGVDGVESLHHSPELRHQWAGTAYAGAIVLAPALYALWRRRSRVTWFFAGVILFSLLAGAEAPGVTDLLGRIPLFDIAINARMIAFAAFGICALASIGLDRWIAQPAGMDLMSLAVAAAIILLGVAVAGDLLSGSFVRLAVAREVIPLFLLFACLRLTRSTSAAVACLIALLLLQRATEVGGLIPTLDRRAFFPNIPGVETMRRDPSPFRIVGLDVLMMPNSAALYRLEDVRGYQAMTFSRLAETFPLWSVPQAVWSNRVDDLSRPFLSLMNVRYAFVPSNARVPPRWRTFLSFPNYSILKNDAALPRAFIPAIVHVGTDPDTLRKMAACTDFGSEAWIETSGPVATQQNGSGRVSVETRGSRLLLHASMDTAGWLVMSETAWRGWRVLLDDRPLEVHYADHAFMAVYLPHGNHELVAEYWPRAFATGATITLATLLALVLISLRARISDRLGVPARPSPSSYPPTLPSWQKGSAADTPGGRSASP
ncbi:MAG: YfhO family protein, partial [Acidobacteriota bacterium]|nr:YfhO family protein [Acidobacteriota bacterium]